MKNFIIARKTDQPGGLEYWRGKSTAFRRSEWSCMQSEAAVFEGGDDQSVKIDNSDWTIKAFKSNVNSPIGQPFLLEKWGVTPDWKSKTQPTKSQQSKAEHYKAKLRSSITSIESLIAFAKKCPDATRIWHTSSAINVFFDDNSHIVYDGKYMYTGKNERSYTFSPTTSVAETTVTLLRTK